MSRYYYDHDDPSMRLDDLGPADLERIAGNLIALADSQRAMGGYDDEEGDGEGMYDEPDEDEGMAAANALIAVGYPPDPRAVARASARAQQQSHDASITGRYAGQDATLPGEMDVQIERQAQRVAGDMGASINHLSRMAASHGMDGEAARKKLSEIYQEAYSRVRDRGY